MCGRNDVDQEKAMATHKAGTRINRRNALKFAGASSMAYGANWHILRGAAAQPLPSPAADPMGIILPETGVTLPSDDVTFRWVDSGDSKALFFKKYFDTFTQAHSNITFDYLGIPWTEIAEIVPLGIRNGDAPDVFQIPTDSIPVVEAVREGWVRPIDDLVPNFEAWKAAFPPSSFVEGINVFNGRVYTFPRSTSKRGVKLTFHNRAYMEAAGFNPEETPLAWDTFREAARKITEAGQGQYFGIIFGGQQTGRWEDTVRFLAALAGRSAAGDIDLHTGEYVYASDEFTAAIELLMSLDQDGSVFPGSMSLNDPSARAQMAQGVAGMILEGEFAIPIWIRENPDFDFGVSGFPIPAEGEFTPITYQNTATNHQWVFADSKHPEIAGEIFYYLGSEAGQLAFVSITGGSDPSVYASANDAAPLDERMRQAYRVFDERMRLGPDPRIRNPETAQIYLHMTRPTPTFGETVQGIFTGQLGDPKTAMQDLNDRHEKAFEEAIAAAQADGANVSRDDFVFPNWDPTRDYLDEDYEAL
jgi:multiple sugar transport system substrate-binding protein